MTKTITRYVVWMGMIVFFVSELIGLIFFTGKTQNILVHISLWSLVIVTLSQVWFPIATSPVEDKPHLTFTPALSRQQTIDQLVELATDYLLNHAGDQRWEEFDPEIDTLREIVLRLQKENMP